MPVEHFWNNLNTLFLLWIELCPPSPDLHFGTLTPRASEWGLIWSLSEKAVFWVGPDPGCPGPLWKGDIWRHANAM